MNEIKKAEDNIFSDLQVGDSEESLAKAQLAFKIHTTIQSRKLTQVQAAKILGLSQPDVSDLARGRLKKFSLDRLIHLLNLLDWDVEIVLKRKRAKRVHGRTHVVAA